MKKLLIYLLMISLSLVACQSVTHKGIVLDKERVKPADMYIKSGSVLIPVDSKSYGEAVVRCEDGKVRRTKLKDDVFYSIEKGDTIEFTDYE